VRTLDPLFKPFTVDEIAAITGSRQVEMWFGIIGTQEGCGVVGLGWMGAFAVYVGEKFLEEGSGIDRARPVVRTVATLPSPQWLKDVPFRKGLVFPACPPGGTATLIRRPPGRVGRMLNLKKLLFEFEVRLKQVFPS
jgi:hypothetical protein